MGVCVGGNCVVVDRGATRRQACRRGAEANALRPGEMNVSQYSLQFVIDDRFFACWMWERGREAQLHIPWRTPNSLTIMAICRGDALRVCQIGWWFNQGRIYVELQPPQQLEVVMNFFENANCIIAYLVKK